MKASLRKALSSLIILTILLILFQNCGPAKVSTGQESKTLASTSPYATPTPAATSTPTINISSTPTPTPPPLPTVAPVPTATPTPTATPIATPTPAPPPPTPTPLMITSQPVASNITMNSATISWSLNMAATGQVEFGTTTAYGSKSTPELSFNYTYHVQDIGVLSAGTIYHFRVVSKNQIGETVYSPDFTFTTVAPTPTPTPSPTPAVSMLKTSGGYCLEKSQQMDTYSANMLVQAPCTGNAVQYFVKTTVSPNVFNVTSSVSGECINVPANLTDEGTIIDFWQCIAGYTGMQWKFQDNGNGTFKMIDSHSLRCLTYNNYSTTTSQQLFISTCQAGNTNQEFHY